MTSIYFRSCRGFSQPASLAWIIYSYSILKKVTVCEIISGVVNHSRLFVLDPGQEATHLIVTEPRGARCESPDVGARVRVFNLQCSSRAEPLKPDEFLQSPLKKFVLFLG